MTLRKSVREHVAVSAPVETVAVANKLAAQRALARAVKRPHPKPKAKP